MTKVELIKHLNKLRKDNKNNWVFYDIICDGKNIEYKSYNTWIQYIKIDGLKFSGLMDITVKQFLDFLNGAL